MSPIDANRIAVASKRFTSLDFWRELVIAARFGLVGIVATAVHIAVVWLLLRETGIAPILANTLAFSVAFGISFAGNYLWTFRSPGNPRRAMFRLFVIAATAFAANTLILTLLLDKGWFLPAVSAVFSASVVPVISFLASRFWGFARHKVSEN